MPISCVAICKLPDYYDIYAESIPRCEAPNPRGISREINVKKFSALVQSFFQLASNQAHKNMPYVLVRDSDSGTLVEGLPWEEIRNLSLRIGVDVEIRDEKNRRLEVDTDTLSVINALDIMGYKVVTSGSFGASDFIWTLFKPDPYL